LFRFPPVRNSQAGGFVLLDYRNERRLDDALVGSQQAQSMNPGRRYNYWVTRISQRVAHCRACQTSWRMQHCSRGSLLDPY